MVPLRLGAIGVGGMGGGHVRAAAALSDDFKIAAVCDANKDTLVRAAAEHDATPYDSFDALCRHDGLDAVLITLPHVLYRDATLAALDAGLHVFKEKPVGRTLEDARILRDRARATGKRVMIAGQSKYTPAFRAAKELVEQGVLGSIFLATGLITYRWGGAVSGNWGWRGIFAQSGGVAVIDSGWHVLDALHWYRGMPSRVYATTGTMPAAPGGSYDVDDKAVLTFDYPDGGIGSVTVTFVAQPSEKRIVLYGTEGTLDITDSRVRHWSGDAATDVPLADPVDSLKAQMSHFAAWIRGETPPMSDIERGYEIQRIVSAAYQSAESGSAVRLLEGEA
ncbi:Gfo/Idh/MocA family oxidoreductase [Candidatus Poribacteria bacterium]|nr:Gfo/Idh/MocA family oxidoreductase [Candidatus Poribacteria bacterium]